MAYCRKCGYKNPDDAVVCGSCGIPLKKTVEKVVEKTAEKPAAPAQETVSEMSQPGRVKIPLRREGTPPPPLPQKPDEPAKDEGKQNKKAKKAKKSKKGSWLKRVFSYVLPLLLGAGGGVGYWLYDKASHKTEADDDDEDTEEVMDDEQEADDEDMAELTPVTNDNDEEEAEEATGDTPDRTAIEAGSDGGRWEHMESGEIAYIYDGERHGSNMWVKDGGKFFYVDASGCRMLNNYSHDGFYAGSDGSWVKSKDRLTDDLVPHNSVKYTDDGMLDIVFSLSNDASGKPKGTATYTYSNGDDNISFVFDVKCLGHSTYQLSMQGSENTEANMTVVDNGKTVMISSAGQTEVYKINH